MAIPATDSQDTQPARRIERRASGRGPAGKKCQSSGCCAAKAGTASAPKAPTKVGITGTPTLCAPSRSRNLCAGYAAKCATTSDQAAIQTIRDRRAAWEQPFQQAVRAIDWDRSAPIWADIAVTDPGTGNYRMGNKDQARHLR